MKTTLAFLAAALALARGAIDADLVTSLPGWNGALPSKQYSGYLSVGDGKHLHYQLVESESNPATDPVVFWFNGGPGCSSLGGYWTEQGPFNVTFDASGNPVIGLRDTRWNQIANVVFLEAPAGVGFSYAETAAGLVFNDTVSAKDNYAALQAFYKGFPELLSNDLYISGESYAGVYVPTLAYQVYLHNEAGVTPQLPLRGILVGNGCTGTETGSCSANNNGTVISVDFLYGKGLYPKSLYDKIQSSCGNFENIDLTCLALLTEMSYNVGPVNIYDVYYPCITSSSAEESVTEEQFTRPMTPLERLLRKGTEDLDVDDDYYIKNPHAAQGPVGCINSGGAGTYLNMDSVRTALHVASADVTGQWTVCTGKISYTPSEPNEPRDIYPTLIKNYRVLIYNGDVDACVPYIGNEQWTSGMGVPLKNGTNGWRPWYVSNQVAGYVTEYADDFTFITVKGSGHMVPQFRPLQAYAFFERFLNKKDF